MSFWDFGRRFVNGLPVVGGITSNLWGDPSQEAVQDAYGQAREEMAKNRSYNMDARMNAMNQAALAFGPRNQMLGQMMGQQGPLMDLTPMLQNPMSQAQQNDIRTQAFGSAPPSDGRAVGGAFSGVGPQNPYRRV
jgi:hypothetical protein